MSTIDERRMLIMIVAKQRKARKKHLPEVGLYAPNEYMKSELRKGIRYG